MGTRLRVVICIFLSFFLLNQTPIANLSKGSHEAGTSILGGKDFETAETVKQTSLTSLKTVAAPTGSGASYKGSSYRNNVNTLTIKGHSMYVFEARPTYIGYGQTTLPDPGTGAGAYNNGKFYYGHTIFRTSYIGGFPFSYAHQLRVGDTFSITRNGVTSVYQVRLREILNVAKSLNDTSPNGTLNQIYNASYKGSYDVALMTCAEPLNSKNEALNRLVIEAVKIR